MSHFSVIRCDFPGCDTVTKPGTTANPQFKEVWICTADTRASPTFHICDLHLETMTLEDLIYLSERKWDRRPSAQ